MGRRSNGEGTLCKRKDGRWMAQAYVTLPNGTTKRICITNRDYETAKKNLRDTLNQEHRSIPFVEKVWTVGEYLDYWLREVQQNRIRETTMIMYRLTVSKHIKPVLAGHKLKTLSVPDVRNAMNALEKRGCPVRTRQKCLQILSTCINNAMREELVFRNVAQLVERPKYMPKETTIWTAEQAAVFLEANQDHPHFVAFFLFLTYGMRRGEVLGLRWSDIDFGNNVIHVRQQIDRINGRIVARDLKTKNSRRNLPLIGELRTVLLEYANKHGIAIEKFNPQCEISVQNTIIASRVGTPMEPKNLERCFHILRKNAGLPRITIHAMRHTAATMLKDLNVPLKDVQLILGHADIATTANIYQHGTSEAQRVALSAVGGRLLAKPS